MLNSFIPSSFFEHMISKDSTYDQKGRGAVFREVTIGHAHINEWARFVEWMGIERNGRARSLWASLS